MTDLFTYAVYLILLGVLIMFTSMGAQFSSSKNGLLTFTNERKLNITHWIALLSISFIAGARYYVGVDWAAYKDVFEGLRSDGSNSLFTGQMEIGYITINQFVIGIGGGYVLMFFIVALISWYFIFKSVPIQILPLTIFFLFTGEYFFWSMNGVRQFFAISIFLYALKFVISRNLVYYIGFILLASLFHTSVLVLLPLYFLPFDRLYNYRIWIVLYLSSFALNRSSVLDPIKESLFNLISNEGGELFSSYAGYANHVASQQNFDLHYGFGYYFNTSMTLSIFLISQYVIEKYPITKTYFILFFIGSCFENIFFEIQIISRFIAYFTFLKPLLLSFIAYLLLNEASFVVAIIVVITGILYFITFLSAIYNSSNLCSPYNFAF